MNLQENIRRILREDYDREYILYRAVGLDEAIKSCEVGHLVYYSRDPMSRDWEVIEYGLGDEASEMSEEEVDEYVNDLVWSRLIRRTDSVTAIFQSHCRSTLNFTSGSSSVNSSFARFI